MKHAARPVGRPSWHPVRVRYHESPDVAAALDAVADDHSLSFAEAQRLVNRKVLAALPLEPVT